MKKMQTELKFSVIYACLNNTLGQRLLYRPADGRMDGVPCVLRHIGAIVG